MASEVFFQVIRSLPHKQRVQRLYRHGLRQLLNWSVNRHAWYPRAYALRAEFEATKGMTNREQIRKTLEHGENLLARFQHWEPLLRPELPGGTAYSINPSLPVGTRSVLEWDKMAPLRRGDFV